MLLGSILAPIFCPGLKKNPGLPDKIPVYHWFKYKPCSTFVGLVWLATSPQGGVKNDGKRVRAPTVASHLCLSFASCKGVGSGGGNGRDVRSILAWRILFFIFFAHFLAPFFVSFFGRFLDSF